MLPAIPLKAVGQKAAAALPGSCAQIGTEGGPSMPDYIERDVREKEYEGKH